MTRQPAGEMRDDFLERLRRNHHASGVRGGVAGKALQAGRDAQEFGDVRLAIAQLAKLRRLRQRIRELARPRVAVGGESS